MGEPQTYNASAASIAPPQQNPDPPSNLTPQIERDPLTSFENLHFQLKADLGNWMTFTLEDRKKKTQWYVKTTSDWTYRYTPEYRHKVLNYIIWYESIHPNGEREVAALAFNGLFPKK